MRVVSFVVVIIGFVVVIVGSLGCSTSKSVVLIPSCADRVEVEGEATRVSKNKFELDHTFDTPFARTELEMKTPAGDRSFELVDSQPDTLRLFAGAATGVVGGALLAASFYNVTAEGQDFFTAIPFYEAVFGVGGVALGVLGVGTGWHPPTRVFRFPDDVCPDEPAYPARKPKPARTQQRPRPRPRALPPEPPPLEQQPPASDDGTYER